MFQCFSHRSWLGTSTGQVPPRHTRLTRPSYSEGYKVLDDLLGVALSPVLPSKRMYAVDVIMRACGAAHSLQQPLRLCSREAT
jgi:hypothetical protein